MVRPFLAVLLLGLAGAGHAQTLFFGSPGARTIWTADDLPDGPPAKGIDVEADQFKFEKPPTGKWLFIWDKTTGNLASKEVAKLGASWTPKQLDFTRIFKLTVRVESKGKPVQAASVELKDAKRTQSHILDASADGKADFYAVQAGKFGVTVTYRADGATADPLKIGFEAPPVRKDAEPTFVVALPGEVETVASGAAGTPSATGGPAEAPKSTSNPFRNLLGFLITTAIAAAVVWFVLKWLRENQDDVKSRLQQMGVEMPQSNEEALADAAAPPVQAIPAPPQKIILDDAAPVVGASVAAASAPPALSGVPRLVRDNGSAFELPEGETLVSREVSGGLDLVGETTVSRRHAVLIRAGDEVRVRDEGSTNGTYVNGAKLDGEAVLRPGDQVMFGAVRLRFEA